MKKLIISAGLSISMIANGLAMAATPEDLGYAKVEYKRYHIGYLKVENDFSKYDSVYITDIVTADADVKQPHQGSSAYRNKDWEFDEEKQQRVQEMYANSFERELAELENLDLVDEVGPNTLILSAKVSEIAPASSYDPMSVPGRSRVFTDTSGSAKIDAVLIDAASGEVVGFVSSAKSLGHHWVNNNSVSNSANTQRAFNSWALQAANTLDNLPAIAHEAGH